MMRNGSNLFDVSGLQNNRFAVPHRVLSLRLISTIGQNLEWPIPVASADHSEPVQRSREGALGLSWSFHLCQLKLRIAQV